LSGDKEKRFTILSPGLASYDGISIYLSDGTDEGWEFGCPGVNFTNIL
jgi:hypothetical protein